MNSLNGNSNSVEDRLNRVKHLMNRDTILKLEKVLDNSNHNSKEGVR